MGIINRLLRSIIFRLDSKCINLHRCLKIGKGTYYSRDNLDGVVPQLIRIGEDCIFAPKSVVLTHDACYFPLFGKYRVAPVIIGDRVFIGYGAVIMPGIKIGDDVIIGAGAVVTSDVKSNCIVAGVPARIIGPWPPTQIPEDQLFTPPFSIGHLPSRREILKFQIQLLKKLKVG